MTGQELELISQPATSSAEQPQIVFIPGGFHGAWCWNEYFLPWFAARGITAHALSLRDHGESWKSGKISQWHLDDYVEDAKQTLTRIEGPVIIAGHSMGGVIAQHCYLDCDNVVGGVFIASSPKRPSAKVTLKLLLKDPIRMILGQLFRNARLIRPAFISFFFSKELDPAKRKEFVSRMDDESFTAIQELFSREPLKRDAEDLRPCLVVAGRDDWSIPLRDHEELCNDFAAELKICPGAHDLMLDVHWEETADTIFEWVRSQQY